MLHITNGGATKAPLERSGVPGRFFSWDDILHDGPTPLLTGDEWIRIRTKYLASAGYGDEQEMFDTFVGKDALERLNGEDEVVFWFEHDLYDQLLLIRHLWWIDTHGRGRAGKYSIVIGTDYLGMLEPEDFPPRFQRRTAITEEQIQLGSAAWKAYCGDDPGKLEAFSDLRPEGRSYLALPYLGRAMHRLFEEFPSTENGLSRCERQILEVLSEGDRSPEQTFIQASTREEDIWLGDWSFWTMVQRLNAGQHPLLTLDVQPCEDRLPTGTLAITGTGRRVLAGGADQVALNGISRWIGGTHLTPERCWRWTGSSLQPPAP